MGDEVTGQLACLYVCCNTFFWVSVISDSLSLSRRHLPYRLTLSRYHIAGFYTVRAWVQVRVLSD